jgi:hypothetical protein
MSLIPNLGCNYAIPTALHEVMGLGKFRDVSRIHYLDIQTLGGFSVFYIAKKNAVAIFQRVIVLWGRFLGGGALWKVYH